LKFRGCVGIEVAIPAALYAVRDMDVEGEQHKPSLGAFYQEKNEKSFISIAFAIFE